MIKFTTQDSLVEIKEGTDSLGYNVIRVLSSNSKNISWGYGSNTARISFTVDDQTFDSYPATSIYFDGVALSDATEFKAAVESMFPNLAGGGGSSYLVYKAELTQTGTDAPVVAIEYINTIGAIVWSRSNVGIYLGTLAGAFTENKTALPPFTKGNGCWLPFYASDPLDYSYQMQWNNVNSVRVSVIINTDGSNADLSDVGARIFIQIEVYP